MNATKRALAAAALIGVAVISPTATAYADSSEAAPNAAEPYPGGYPAVYPGFYGAGPLVAPGSTQALYNNNAVASGTQGLLNKIAFGVL
ncbi:MULTISPECIES: hypothetical protein [Streptomyces]|uniref:Secreted protein n=2 Tax=Streptomyces TaxID=1883 RepID=A0ABU2W7Z9_9ACTN|nr:MULTISPECIES: hypothetical protein [Streptomyces]MDT0488323.1 hypothetical protein [Streptomyces sp. DSM 41640]MDT0494010.1 hypothetical protein [Streptomyces griseus]